jgi:Cu-Zn family superoxide dismutase
MKIVLLSLTLLSLAACSHHPPQPTRADAMPAIAQEPPVQRAPNPATSVISGPSGVKGSMVITNIGKNVHIVGEFTGLAPNSEHGVHIHENGTCDGDGFKAAGAHFNPWKTKHGGDDTKMRHAGDLGNIKADANGYAKLDVKVQTGSDIGVFGGKSVIIHAKRDDAKTDPSGNSGDRIACGLIVEKM